MSSLTPEWFWLAWNTDPLIVFGLAVLVWIYARGMRAVWRVAGRGRGVRLWQAAAFGAGVLTLVVALVSPLDLLSDVLFAAHMAQHLLLVTVAAPLIALGEPLVAGLWAWPRRQRVAIGRAWASAQPLLGLWRIVSSLPVAFTLHSVALWLWHAPVLYEGALRNGALHATEHLVLLGTGLLFWSTAWTSLGRGGRAPGASVVAVFALGAQCTLLGGLIMFAARPWYPFYADTAPRWGLTAVDDQVLAGALMWVPAGLVYLAFALVLLSGAPRRSAYLARQRSPAE